MQTVIFKWCLKNFLRDGFLKLQHDVYVSRSKLIQLFSRYQKLVSISESLFWANELLCSQRGKLLPWHGKSHSEDIHMASSRSYKQTSYKHLI